MFTENKVLDEYIEPVCSTVAVRAQGIICISGEDNDIANATEYDLGSY